MVDSLVDFMIYNDDYTMMILGDGIPMALDHSDSILSKASQSLCHH